MSQGYIYPPPADGKPFRLNMGLRSLEPALWLEGGADLEQQIPERLALQRNARDVVYQELPGYRAAIDELVSLIAENLAAFHSGDYQLSSQSVTHIPTGTTIDLASDELD